MPHRSQKDSVRISVIDSPSAWTAASGATRGDHTGRFIGLVRAAGTPAGGTRVPMAAEGDGKGPSGRLTAVRAMSRVERFFERLVERPSARLFKTRLQPLQILRGSSAPWTPSAAPRAVRASSPISSRSAPPRRPRRLPPAEEVAGELASGALSFARAHGYALRERPAVTLRPDPRCGRARSRSRRPCHRRRAAGRLRPPRRRDARLRGARSFGRRRSSSSPRARPRAAASR